MRVGSVPYLVGRPLDLGLGSRACEGEVELVRAVPARLVAGLRDGSLDVALVSSIELFRRPGYRYLPGLAVVGRGELASIRLFLRRPLSDVRRIALDPASRTTSALLRVLATDLGLDAELLETGADEDPRASDADGWLRIGDAALRESLEVPALPRVDLCSTWVRATGLPFAFAVWIVAPGAPVEGRERLFRDSRVVGAAAAAACARDHARAAGLPEAALLNYLLEECSYEIEDELAATLEEFRRRAAAHDLVDATLSAVPHHS
ncbi:MAG: menaquinone biosynthesis protein [Planctomycetota bacterium]